MPSLLTILAVGLLSPSAHAAETGVEISTFQLKDRDGTLQVQVGVANTGSTTSTGFYVDLFQGLSEAPELGTMSDLYAYVPPLDAGASQRVDFFVPMPDDGGTIYAIADTEGTNKDSDTSDNQVGGWLSWEPDLRIERVEIVEAGDLLDLVVHVRNVGNASAGSFYVDGFDDELAEPAPGEYGEAYAWVAGLDAGEVAEVELSVAFNQADQDIYLLLDTDEWVDERDESNNTRHIALTKGCLAEYSAQVCAIGDRIATRVDTILLAAGVELSEDEYTELLVALTERTALSSEAISASLASPDTADAVLPMLDAGLQKDVESLDEDGIAERVSHLMELMVVDAVDVWLEEYGLLDELPDVNEFLLHADSGAMDDVRDQMGGHGDILSDSTMVGDVSLATAKEDLLDRVGGFGWADTDSFGSDDGFGYGMASSGSGGRLGHYLDAADKAQTVNDKIVDFGESSHEDQTKAVKSWLISATGTSLDQVPFVDGPGTLDALGANDEGSWLSNAFESVAGAIASVLDYLVDLIWGTGDPEEENKTEEEKKKEAETEEETEDEQTEEEKKKNTDDDDDDDDNDDDDEETASTGESQAAFGGGGGCDPRIDQPCDDGAPSGGGSFLATSLGRVVPLGNDPWFNPSVGWGPEGPPIQGNGTAGIGLFYAQLNQGLNPSIDWGDEGPPQAIGQDISDIVVVDPSSTPPDYED